MNCSSQILYVQYQQSSKHDKNFIGRKRPNFSIDDGGIILDDSVLPIWTVEEQ